MAKEKDYETIEGGDDSSDAFDFESTQVKPATKDKDEGSTSKDEEDFRDRPTEEHRIEGGDTEWDEEQEGADLEDSGEDKKEEVKEEEVEEKVEKEDEVGEVKELSEEEKQDKKVQEDAIKYLDETGGTKYIVKGKEYDLRDLSPQEFKNRFSLAGRAHERMQEIADKEKTLIERERLAEDGARRSQDIMHKYGGERTDRGEDLPDILKPNEDDTDLERSLKEMNANLYTKVDKLERGFEQQDFTNKEQHLYRQLDSLEQEFPMMSKEEVVAVKSLYEDADVRVIAENSHNNRVSDDYLDAVFKARPDKLREIGEKAIEEHLMKNPKVRKVSRKKSSTVASGKVSSGKKKTPRTLDQIEAHVDSRGGWDNIMPDTDED